jgi:tRNA pseudouridine38-40 synthase
MVVMRVKLIIEYNGGNYCGWQRQQNGLSIQQVIEEALFELTGVTTSVTGAGRTDAGVHALSQAAHFDTQSTIPADKFCYALNMLLPEDIRIKESSEVGEDFHARFSAQAKEYRYTIYNSEHASALYNHLSAHVRQKLDISAMKRAASFFFGTHDFKAFMAAGSDVKDTVRTIYHIMITHEEPFITLDITGSGFLYNMVRIIAGTLIEAGKGRMSCEDIKDIIEGRNRFYAGPTASAKGLMLVKVYYGDYERDDKVDA